jgi:uncharacterized protein YraI
VVSQRTGAAVGGAIALLVTTPKLQAKNFPAGGTAYVATPPGYNLNLRSGPGTRFPAVNTLARGTPITLTGYAEDGWAQLTNGAWAAGNLINVAPVPGGAVVGQAYTAYIATPVGYNLNVRSGPGTQYAAINTLARGTQITITGYAANGWAQLASGGWVAGNWVQVGASVNRPNPVSPPPTQGQLLQLGSRGDEVLRLERRLQALNYLPPTFNPDTYLGTDTQQAIRAFQQRNGLPVDGVVGPQTRNLLYSSSAIAAGSAPGIEPLPPTTPIDPVDPTPTPTSERRVSTDDGMDAIIFSGPGTEFDLLGFVPNGELVTTTGETQGNWSKLSGGGWIYTDWLETP